MNDNSSISKIKISLWGRIKAYFVAGILIAAPLFITAQIALWLIQFFNSYITSIISYIAGLFPEQYNPQKLLEEYLDIPFVIPALGLIILILFITLIGALTAGIIGRWFVAQGENFLEKMPFIRTLYSASKQILSTVMQNKSDAFRHAVLVEYPRPNLWAIAFITGSASGELKDKLPDDMVSLFLPTTPNPTSGFLLFVPKKDIMILDMPIEQAIKVIISAGIVQNPNDGKEIKISNDSDDG